MEPQISKSPDCRQTPYACPLQLAYSRWILPVLFLLPIPQSEFRLRSSWALRLSPTPLPASWSLGAASSERFPSRGVLERLLGAAGPGSMGERWSLPLSPRTLIELPRRPSALYPLPAAQASRDQACLLSPDAGQPLIPLVEPDSVWLFRSFSPSLPLSPPRCFDFALASLPARSFASPGAEALRYRVKRELPAGHGRSLLGSHERS